MNRKPERTIRQARLAATHLESLGDMKRAEDVRALIRSNEAFSAALTRSRNEYKALLAALSSRTVRHG